MVSARALGKAVGDFACIPGIGPRETGCVSEPQFEVKGAFRADGYSTLKVGPGGEGVKNNRGHPTEEMGTAEPLVLAASSRPFNANG
jgi:hypothetical protein